MLIEFRVRNFRSMRDEQVLSLVATKDKTRPNNTLASGLKAAPFLLRSAAIYGANASGKSNLIKAMQYMKWVVADSASVMQPGQTFNAQPFRLDGESHNQSIAFEVTFILEGTRYQYGFEFSASRILREYLFVYKSSKPQKWFERVFDVETKRDNYKFSPVFTGRKNMWEESTRPNALFLSMAVQLNSAQLLPVFSWFREKLIILNEPTQFMPQFSINKLRTLEGKKEICGFLADADISIADIDVITHKQHGQEYPADIPAGKAEIQNKAIEVHEIRLTHVTDKGKAVFDVSDESLGTQHLLFMSGPIIEILKQGLILVVDELDRSLHPLLLQKIVELFHNPDTNPKGAQLIFVTHNTSLLDDKLLRRDQFWLVEKDHAQASELFPLTDFSPRKKEALEKGYLMGRYGAVPLL